jgi:glycopeptide antibiotics resistance protein
MYRPIALWLSLVSIVPFGLVTKFYRGWGQAWLNDAFGGIPYVIFWMLLGAVVWPQSRPRTLALGVFCATCALEFLQLWQPPWLQAVRATLLGRLVLGNTFTWGDFLYYAIGCGLGWLWLRAIRTRRSDTPPSAIR